MKMKMTSLISAAACAIVALAATAKETETPVLRIYTWADYVSPEVVEGFEKSANCRVEIDTFDSNETMFEQIKAGKKDCDIIMPSSYLVELMAEEGLVVELDHSKIPNVRKNFDKRFAKLILDPSFRYNAPYAVTYTGLMYDKGKVPTGTDVTSWSILDNPAFKDRITLLDDQREVIGFNHKMSRGRYAGHVAFADGHVEKIFYPIGGMSVQDLTENLCQGHEVTFDGTKYTDAQR